jgi:hypothetical protein
MQTSNARGEFRVAIVQATSSEKRLDTNGVTLQSLLLA